MAQNKTLDPKLTEQLKQHYAVNPRSGFLPALKSKLIGRFPVQRPARHKGRKLAYGLISAAIVLLIVLFATPIGRVLAQEFVELFQRAESDVIPYPPALTAIAEYTKAAALDPTNTPEVQISQTPTPTRTPNPRTDPNSTIEEIEEAAGFDVLVPSMVPSIFKFSGGAYLPEENMSILVYDLVGLSTNGFQISQEPVTSFEDCNLCSDIGPGANVQTVHIGDSEGEFVIGVWKFEDGYKIWTPEPWMRKLRWQTNGTVFEISFFGPPMTMQKSDMVHLAESMTSSNEP